MKFEVRKSSLENLDVETLVVFASKPSKTKAKKANAKKGETPQLHVAGVSKALHAKIDSAVAQGVFTGASSDCVFFRDAHLSGAKHLMLIGLGSEKDFEHEALRKAAASVLSGLKAQKSRTAALAFDSLPHNSLSGDVITQALTEGFLLSDYSFADFKKKNEKQVDVERILIVSSAKSKSFEKGIEVGTILAECQNFARWLGDRPGNRMTPTNLANEALKGAKGTKLKVNIWDKARIKAEKMGSFLSVSLGSSEEPKFIVMEYNGAAANKKPICLVGKGLTFDSGGISIKPSAAMEEMKYDMCGGAAVIASLLAIARLKLKVNVIGLIPATENMPGPAANKPGDIVIARNGKSIEINNTDAEGRLILNDALVYACEQKPALICDIATLTGAMVVALGNIHTGFFTRNDKLAEKVEAAANTTGELVWRMPLIDSHGKDMKGTYADLSNISSGKGAGSATAAAFLENFVDSDIPWVHFDIAGTGWHCGDRLSYAPKRGATGVMVRTFVKLAMNHT